MKFVSWTVLPGTPYTCLTLLLQKDGTVKTWLLWNWLFRGTFFSTISGRNRLLFSRTQKGWPDVRQNFIILPCDSFLIRAAAEEHWKLSCFLECPECMWHYFLQFCHARLQSILIPVKHHREAQICRKFTFSCRDEVFGHFFCEQIMKIEFHFQSFESNVSFSTRSNSELGLDFAIRRERKRIFRKKLSERVELFFLRTGDFRN